MTSLGIDIGGTSIKIAALRDGQTLFTRRGAPYQQPDRAQLTATLRETLAHNLPPFDTVGLCVPGLFDRATRTVTHSINIPGLNGFPLDDLLTACLPLPPSSDTPGEGRDGGPQSQIANMKSQIPTLLTDTHAAAYDLYTSRSLTGRLLLLALGTGVGAAVWDHAGLLRVDGESPGHFGQIDVSLDPLPPIGPDGGSGSLEAYLGAPALRLRYGEHFASLLPSLPITDPPLRALARAVRIAHAIYRPHHIVLAGGIGNLLRPLMPALRELICTHLSRIARPDWTLNCGDDDYHAARGAAKLASRESNRSLL
jgi:predicted NBD/HSP70 family sugar kinase